MSMPPISFPWQNDAPDGQKPRLDPVAFSRHLRKASTDAEHKLWTALRNRRFRGQKFRRQHPVDPYVLDFYCEHLKLAIELDGGSHVTQTGLAYDKRRSEHLAKQGIRVIRISNYEMLVHTETLLNWLWHQLEKLDSEDRGST